MANILLDTNALLWLLDDSSGKLGSRTRKVITNADVVFVSAVSILEIQIKSMLGKLTMPDNIIDAIKDSSLEVLDMSADHAVAIKSFPTLAKHGPFDRILLAQAKTEQLVFVTADKILLRINVKGVEIIDATV